MRADVGNFPHRLFFFALALLRLTELYNRELYIQNGSAKFAVKIII